MSTRPLSALSVLVLDAHESHSLCAIRSLGRKGARVAAASPKPHAMGFASRYTGAALHSPNPAAEPGRFADWLLTTLRRDGFDAVLFFGEASANVVAEHGDAIRALTGCLVPAHETFLLADRKDRVTRLAQSVGVLVPATRRIDRPEDAVSLRDALAFPVIVKGTWGSGGHQVRFATTAEEFAESVRLLSHSSVRSEPEPCLVQEYVAGVGYGFTALCVRGEVVAEFMHRRLAEHDVARGARLTHAATGAVSIYDPDLQVNAMALLSALCWDGMAMVEFRRSRRDGRFYLMEINPRFPGSLELAIASGVDFPSLYVQHAAGRPVPGPARYQVGLRYRWLLSKGLAGAVEHPLGYLQGAAGIVRPDTRCDLSLRDPRPHAVQLREAAWWLREYARELPQATRTPAWLPSVRGWVPAAFFAIVLVAMHDFTYPAGRHSLDLAWEGLCMLLGLAGLALRSAALGFAASGDLQSSPGRPARTLETNGLYSLMRHPMYAGTLLLWLGVAAFPRKPWLVGVTMLACWLYYRRALLAEEASLSRQFGARYAAWAAVTPRFLPRWSRWRRPEGGFALARVMRSENNVFFLFVACLTILEVVGDVRLQHRLAIDAMWGALFGSATALYAALSVVSQRVYSRS